MTSIDNRNGEIAMETISRSSEVGQPIYEHAEGERLGRNESTMRETTGNMTQRLKSGFDALSQPILRQSIAFFLFGTINNAIYVVILTAALELIPKGTPTGLVAFFNIFPALIAKAIWPYVLKGTVRYSRRIWSCVSMSFVGLLVIALFPSLLTRLAGIALASFSSGLGELTFLQLSTRFNRRGAGRAVAWFSSGTGAAGLVGALAWWIVRPLGVTKGLLSLSFLPVGMGFTYAFILTSVQAVDDAEEDAKGSYEPLQAEAFDVGDDSEDEEEVGEASEERENAKAMRRDSQDVQIEDSSANVPLAISPHASSFGPVLDQETGKRDPTKSVGLSLKDKIELIKPMLFFYIVPLVLVYFFEYTINQGVAPTLLYPLPTRSNHPLLSLVIKQLKDYYPFYQLTYQTFVFLSRSSISIFRLPAIPKKFLWMPALLQGLLLILLTTESVYAWFRESIASPLAIVLVCVEGLAGGSAYVSVFYQIGTDNTGSKMQRNLSSIQEEEAQQSQNDQNGIESELTEARRAQEHEFRIGCVGVGDTMGIMAAALFSMPLQLALCDAQVRRGRDLCKQV